MDFARLRPGAVQVDMQPGDHSAHSVCKAFVACRYAVVEQQAQQQADHGESSGGRMLLLQEQVVKELEQDHLLPPQPSRLEQLPSELLCYIFSFISNREKTEARPQIHNWTDEVCCAK